MFSHRPTPCVYSGLVVGSRLSFPGLPPSPPSLMNTLLSPDEPVYTLITFLSRSDVVHRPFMSHFLYEEEGDEGGRLGPNHDRKPTPIPSDHVTNVRSEVVGLEPRPPLPSSYPEPLPLVRLSSMYRTKDWS